MSITCVAEKAGSEALRTQECAGADCVLYPRIRGTLRSSCCIPPGAGLGLGSDDLHLETGVQLFAITDQPIQGEALDATPQNVADPRFVDSELSGNVLL
jgi:hypothetical protein